MMPDDRSRKTFSPASPVATSLVGETESLNAAAEGAEVRLQAEAPASPGISPREKAVETAIGDALVDSAKYLNEVIVPLGGE